MMTNSSYNLSYKLIARIYRIIWNSRPYLYDLISLQPLRHTSGVQPSTKYVNTLNDENLAFAKKEYLKDFFEIDL